MMKEIWKDIAGYEGYYQISNTGSVKSLDRVINVIDGKRIYDKHLTGKILYQRRHGKGYKTVSLLKDCESKSVYIHRLVAQAFIPNDANCPMINHKNAVKNDNCAENLEWCTNGENVQYAYDLGTHSNSKAVVCLSDGKIFISGCAAGKFYKLNQRNISECCNGKRKTCGGLKFSFTENGGNK
jgi:hypothetical protein